MYELATMNFIVIGLVFFGAVVLLRMVKTYLED
jgi:hypothetical protein